MVENPGINAVFSIWIILLSSHLKQNSAYVSAHWSFLVSLSHVSTTESASDTLQVYLYWNNALELVVIRNGEQKTYKLETDSVVDFFEKLEDLKPIFQGSWNKNEKRGVYSMGFEFDGARYVIQGTVQYQHFTGNWPEGALSKCHLVTWNWTK